MDLNGWKYLIPQGKHFITEPTIRQCSMEKPDSFIRANDDLFIRSALKIQSSFREPWA